jgi:glucan biosynthesis protein C
LEVSAQVPKVTGEAIKPGKTRIYFIDYLRAALVSLVILHHTAITYGGSGSFYYTEPATDPVASLVLTLFTNFNQAWFLGAFFLVSAYFTPASLDRKGAKLFVKDRLLRLFIPLLVFFFVLNPLIIYIAFYHMTSVQLVQQGITPPMGLNLTFISQSVGNGPLWFVELLLIFEFGYVVWRVAGTRLRKRDEGEGGRPFPSARRVGAFIVVLAVSAYLWRIVVPLNAEVLGFPSLFDLPQYLGLFIVGLAAARSDWLVRMPAAMAKRFFRVALVASATLLPLSIIGTAVTSLGWGSLIGYGSLSSAIYAMWDSTFAVGMTMFAISFFRGRFNSPGRFWGFAAKNFYAAYFLQATVIVTFSALILYQLHTESLLKFALAAVMIVPSTWGLAYLVRRIPYVDRVL